jgi:hypothetical protein
MMKSINWKGCPRQPGSREDKISRDGYSPDPSRIVLLRSSTSQGRPRWGKGPTMDRESGSAASKGWYDLGPETYDAVDQTTIDQLSYTDPASTRDSPIDKHAFIALTRQLPVSELEYTYRTSRRDSPGRCDKSKSPHKRPTDDCSLPT